MKKMISLISLLMVLVLVLTACGGGGGSIEGTWKLTGGSGEGLGNDFTQALQMITSMGGSLTMTFKNGKVTLDMSILGQSQQEESTYKVNGNKLEIEGSSVEFTIKGNTLTMSADGTSMTFERQ